MKIKCEYCGSYISDTDEKCPNCGGTNSHLMRSAEGIPKTVEELKAFCASHDMPLERMRFFLGEDYKGARAFGIYEEDGDFVVYKNKADGSRAVRYRGKDEAYAVNEIYQKLKSEVQQRKSRVVPVRRAAVGEKKIGRLPGCLLTMAVFALIAVLFMSCLRRMPDAGYYEYGGNSYYYDYTQDWFAYDDALDTWYPTDVESELSDNYGDYWQSSDYDYSYGTEDFDESEYGDSSSSSSSTSSDSSDSDWASDWDSSDWDSDYSSWDSGSTDWSSDW